MKKFWKHPFIAASVLALALTGCGGGSDEMPDPPPPTAEEVASDALERAQMDLAALPATATDAERLTAEQAVRDAAKAVVDALVEADSMVSVVDAARVVLNTAQSAVDATQTRINDAAEQARMDEEERVRVAAEQKKIDDAEMALADAQAIVGGLPDYTPDTVRIPLERAVHQAAMALVTVLEDAGIPVAPADLVEAGMAVTTAMAAVEVTQQRIDDEADRQRAEMDAQKKVTDARTKLDNAKAVVAGLPDYTPDTVLLEAQKAVHTAATDLVTALRDAGAPSTEVDPVRQDAMTAMNDIEATEDRIAAAEETARLQREQTEKADNERTMISTARQEYMTAKADFEALADDAFYAVRLAARQKVRNAADKWKMAVEDAMHHTPMLADVDAARNAFMDAEAAVAATESGGKYPNERLVDARSALASATTDAERELAKVDVLQALIDNPDATPTKQEMLYQAQAELDALADDASLTMKLVAQQKVFEAAKAWKMELEKADAAHSMVMMAQGEMDAAQMMVEMTMAMMARGTQIAESLTEANSLADKLRMAAVQRSDAGDGFDHNDSSNGHRVTVTRHAEAYPMMMLTGNDVADYEDAAEPQDIAGWYGCGFRSNPITESGASRSLIPIQPDH